MRVAESEHLFGHSRYGVLAVLDDIGDALADDLHVLFLHAARGDGGSAYPDAAGHERFLRIVGDGILVDGDMRLIQPLFELFARDSGAHEVEEHEVVVRAAAHEVHALGEQSFGKGLGVCDDLFLILSELGRERLLERHRLSRDDVHERTALGAGENGLVDELCQLLVVGHDEPAARSAKGLVRGGGHEIRIGHGRGMQPRCHESRDVCDVHHEVCADFVRDRLELVEFYRPCIRRSARDDEFRLVFQRLLAHVLEVYPARLGVQPVGHELEELAAQIDGRTVREVSAFRKGHTQHGVTGLQYGVIHREVRVGTAVRLDVGVLHSEELFCAFDGELLRTVDKLTAAVVTLAGIPFRVLVGVKAACRRHDCGGNYVFACDEFEIVLLTAELLHHGIVQFAVYGFYAFEIYHKTPVSAPRDGRIRPHGVRCISAEERMPPPRLTKHCPKPFPETRLWSLYRGAGPVGTLLRSHRFLSSAAASCAFWR